MPDQRTPRIGIVGAGSVLWAYLQQLDRLVPRGLAELGPICARRPESWPRIRERRPGVELVATAQEVVQSSVDIVVVITDSGSHAGIVQLALDAGKHVLCEKPFALTAEDGQRLAEEARRRNLHLVAAPFVQLSPTFRALWSEIDGGAIGRVHTARGLYGVTAPDWNTWMEPEGPTSDLGIYNLKSLTSILGPISEVTAVEGHGSGRGPGGAVETALLTAVHAAGAVSSIISSWQIQAYRRPALELYGTEGTANLLGDDWDPRGYELYDWGAGAWRSVDPIDPTWLWTDGLRELVLALRENRHPRASIEQDIHLLDVLTATRRSAVERAPIRLESSFDRLDAPPSDELMDAGHIHDHTRSPDEQR